MRVQRNDTTELLQTKEKLQKEKERIKYELPHLYGWPWYPWAKKFFDSDNKMNLLCAANQISKSSTQVRKMLHWATEQTLWPRLWGRQPNQFWYLYPSKEVATVEFEKKWIPEFMPRGDMKKSAYYGWEAEYDHKFVKAIHFFNGMSIYFKTYAQDPKTLQSGSCYAIFCDEELPEHLYDELKFRLAGTNGYFHMVFTATMGQEMWWRAMEAIGTDQELFPKAHKQTVSMYDCLEYLDGVPSPWTVDRIRDVEEGCKSNAEVQRRVNGRFVKEEGRKYHAFDPTRHYVKPFAIPDDWLKVVGVDIGSGGQTGHPSAISFIAIRPDFRYGVIYKGKRMDGVQTTAGDVANKFVEMKDPKEAFMFRKYDQACADFGTISDRRGLGFTSSEKSHDVGEHIINTLFKYDMLQIFDTDELRPLGTELLTLQSSTPKKKAKDDYIDSARYPAVSVNWDFTWIDQLERDKAEGKEPEQAFVMPQTKEEWDEYHDRERQKQADSVKNSGNTSDWESEYRAEINEWNEMYGN